MIKLSDFLKNIVMTTLTSFITVISLVFVMRFLALGLGPEEFGAYSLARRIIANIAPLALLSTEIALVRYVAMTDKIKQQSAYLISSLLASGTALVVIAIMAVSAASPLTQIIFNSSAYTNLFHASLFFLFGYCVFLITYSFFRGRQEFKTANILQVCLMAAAPFFIALLFAQGKNSAFIVTLMGAAFLLSLIPLTLTFKKLTWPSFPLIRSSIKTILRYGLPRVPAGFAFAALLTLGPFLAARTNNVEESGYFIIGQNILRIIESAIVGFGLVALPKISQLIAEKKESFLISKIEDILVMILQLGLFATIHIFIWSEEIIIVWLSSDYAEAVPIMKIIILALVPYLGYVIMRSIVDAVDVRAINTFNLFLSLTLATALSLLLLSLGLGMTGLAIGTTSGFVLLGILTGLYLIRRYKIKLKNSLLHWVLVLNVIFAFAVLLIKKHFFSSLIPLHSLILGFGIEGVLFLSYLYFLHHKKARWILELKKRIVLSK